MVFEYTDSSEDRSYSVVDDGEVEVDPWRDLAFGHFLDICQEMGNTMADYCGKQSEEGEENWRPEGDEGCKKVVNMETFHSGHAQV